MQSWLERVWYGEGRGGLWLRPLAWLFGSVTGWRRFAYRAGWISSSRAARPVVVVGNLSVGGSGKTPLVAWLAGQLAARGLKPGIISRGYGGSSRAALRVTAATDPTLAGDEPVLLARRTGVPVAVARDRLAAAALLAPEVDLLIADDGLQHYRLERDLEIVVIDGTRRFGNCRLLPAGPLREPLDRIADADLIVVNGGPARADDFVMTIVPGDLVALADGARRRLAEFKGQRVHAVAAIGNPGRFFATLRAAGLDPIEHPHPDHARLAAGDFSFGDALPILMTEKDAVKCAGLAQPRMYFLEVAATFAAADAERLLDTITALARSASRLSDG